MNTSQLPYIIAIAATGNMSEASRQLGVSQPTLSKYLKKLELEVGLELFFHNKREYILTPAGQLYVKTAQRILEQMRHAKASIAALDRTQEEQLRIGLSPNRGIAIMAQIFPEFDKRHPQVHLVLQEGYANTLKEQLVQGELDALLTTYAEQVPAGLAARPIHQEELVLAVPAFHPAVRHEASVLDELPYADLEEFRNAVFILPAKTSTLYTLVQSIFKSSGFMPQVTTTTPNIVMQEALIRSGNRVGFLPAYYVHPNPSIAYFRLKVPARLVMAYMTREGHSLSGAERYLLYLLVRYHLRTAGNTILWNRFLCALLWEFDPIEAAAQRLEVPHGS